LSTTPFIPVIVGTDMNAYNMAISFHEEYNIKPILIGKMKMSFTSLSTIIEKIEIYPELGDSEQFVTILIKEAEKLKHLNKKLLLVGTNDLYVRLIIENKEILKEYYKFNYINESLMNQLQYKSNFYRLCERVGIDIPATLYYDCSQSAALPEPLYYPVILKPSNGILYYKHKFAGQQKVYKIESKDEMKNVINTINASGYNDELLIQDYIPGDDTYLWDSVIYLNSSGQAELVSFAQVVLQEHTLTAIGNYSALITRFNAEIMSTLKLFLEEIGYVGFANFDLKYDTRVNKFKVLEVNIRQGRSSYYITAAGYNMAKYLVDDVIYKKEKPLAYVIENYLFTVVPKVVLRKFVKNEKVRLEIKDLITQKKFGNPLFYKQDKHPKRKLYLFCRQLNYYLKYKKYKWQ